MYFLKSLIFKKLKPQLRCLCTKANNSFYATTPIFYVNAAPHIGHLYSAAIADAVARYQKLRYPKQNVHLLTGTDEHGTKIQQASALAKVPVDEYCNNIADSYRKVFDLANVAYTDFIRTTEQRHEIAVTAFWRSLQRGGHIYQAQYSGWYCVSDETFLTESQLRLDEATGARFSLESNHPVEWTQEQNYMFRLSALQDEVRNWVQKGARIRPVKFEKILLDMLSEPLPDVSISRPANRVHWAIPVPDDKTQTVYVWLDALINYLTSIGYPNNKYHVYWPANVQVIGKDILKFHGIYWPAFLLAAGLEPPSQLLVHSHWTVDGQKMSKSKHNVVDPLDAAKLYSMEGLRYFLLREGVAHSDGNYSETKALRILNSELADTLGNLLSRACAKALNPQQIYPCLHQEHLENIMQMDAAKHLQVALKQLAEKCEMHYNECNFYLVVDTVMSVLHAANNFFESARPWELKPKSGAAVQNSENVQRLETIIGMTMDVLRLCGIILQPIVPHLSEQLLNKLNVPQTERSWRNLHGNFANSESKSLADLDAVLFRRIMLKEESDKPTKIKQQPQKSPSTKKQKEEKKVKVNS